MSIEILTPSNMKELCERPTVTPSLHELSKHFLDLIELRRDTESMAKKEEITDPHYQRLSTKWGTYEETASLLDHVIYAVLLEIRDSENQCIIRTPQGALEDLRTFYWV